MLSAIIGVFVRITSNSFLNVFQKLLSKIGNSSNSINFGTYLGLSALSLFLAPFMKLNPSWDLVLNFLIMGILGALGNFFMIKALSLGELSSLAPINAYKPVVAMVIALFYLKEIPSMQSVSAIILIILGTYLLNNGGKNFNKSAVFYRILALIFSGSEAVFIKKIILLTNIPASFALWAVSGLIFAFLFLAVSKQKFMIKKPNYLAVLIIMALLMQYSTNFVFSKINVSSALALFQLSTLLSVFLGVNIFKEKGLLRKLTASTLMIIGAITIILYS